MGCRRVVLATVAAALTLGMTGCSAASSGISPSAAGQSSSESGPSGVRSPTPTPTVTQLRLLATGATLAVLLRTAVGRVWGVTSDHTVVQVDASGDAKSTLPVPGVTDLAFSGSDMYVLTADAVDHIDLGGKVLRRYPVDGRGIALAVSRKTLYVPVFGPPPHLLAIDMATGTTRSITLKETFDNSMGPNGVVVDGNGVVWTLDGRSLDEISGSSMTLVHRYPTPIIGSTLAVAPAGIFIASSQPGAGVARLTPGGSAVSPCWTDGDALQLVPEGRIMWASAAAGLSEFDSTTCKLLATASAPDGDNSGNGIAVLPGQVWLAYGSGHFQRFATN